MDAAYLLARKTHSIRVAWKCCARLRRARLRSRTFLTALEEHVRNEILRSYTMALFSVLRSIDQQSTVLASALRQQANFLWTNLPPVEGTRKWLM